MNHHLRNSSNYVWSTSYFLGKGATGFVYQGVHKKTGDAVAVKTFNSRSQLRPLEVQMREFEVMKVLSHENIVKLIAIEDEEQSSKSVIIMELCTGGSLYTILEDPQNSYGLEEDEFLCVLKDISAGMKYLRDNSIIHRDLKPGNIMKFITEDIRSVYKLTDFGAARVLDDGQTFMSLYGTEEYLHPDMYERAVLHHMANKSFGATVDLWSIGITLYHVATGSLPFRPYGGRENKATMYYLLTNKASDVISGVQHSENGPIEWSKELPKTCLLNQGLRDLVKVLLAGILECDEKKMWSFDQFFEYVTDILSRKKFNVFYMNEGKEITLYMQPDMMFKDIKDQIAVSTNVPYSNQLLLFDKSLFVNQINVSTEVSTYPVTTSVNQPILLVHLENTNVKDVTRLGSVSTCIPMFPSNLINNENDALLAKTCCSVAHAIKRSVIKIVRCQELLLKLPGVLLTTITENTKRLCADSEILKLKSEDINQRFEQLEKFAEVVNLFSSLWLNEHHEACEKELKKILEIISEKKEQKNQIRQKIHHFLSAVYILKQRILISMRLQNEWDQSAIECTNLTGSIETADTYVTKIRDSWQSFVRDRSIKNMTPKDPHYQFHMLERVKIQQTCKKLLSLLREKCSISCLQAFNKLDEWYSGMQAAMVQFRCLEADYVNDMNELKMFASALQSSENEIYESCQRILSQLKYADVSGRKSNVSQESTETLIVNENGSKKASYRKVLSQIRNLKKEHCDLWKIAEENDAMIQKFGLMFKEMQNSNSDGAIDGS